MRLKEIRRELTAVDDSQMVRNPVTFEDAVLNISVGLKVLILILTLVKGITGERGDRKLDAWIKSFQIIAGGTDLLNQFKK